MIRNKKGNEFAKVAGIIAVLLFALLATKYIGVAKNNLENVTDQTLSLQYISEITGVPIVTDRVIKFDAIGELDQDFLKFSKIFIKNLFTTGYPKNSDVPFGFEHFQTGYSLKFIDDGQGIIIHILTRAGSEYHWLNYTQDSYSFLRGSHLVSFSPNELSCTYSQTNILEHPSLFPVKEFIIDFNNGDAIAKSFLMTVNNVENTYTSKTDFDIFPHILTCASSKYTFYTKLHTLKLPKKSTEKLVEQSGLSIEDSFYVIVLDKLLFSADRTDNYDVYKDNLPGTSYEQVDMSTGVTQTIYN